MKIKSVSIVFIFPMKDKHNKKYLMGADVKEIAEDLFMITGSGLALGVAAYISTTTSVSLTRDNNYSTDDNMQRAHNYLLWSAIVGWIIIGIIILLIIGYILFFHNNFSIGGLFKFFLCLVLIGMIICGALAIAAANTLSQITGDKTASQAYFDAILVAAINLGAIFLMIVAFILVINRKPANKSMPVNQGHANEPRQGLPNQEAQEILLGEMIGREQATAHPSNISINLTGAPSSSPSVHEVN